MPKIHGIAVCMAVAGCASHATPAFHTPVASKACWEVARTRMNDAAANNYDPSLQQVIFRGTYQDCVLWQNKAIRGQRS